MQSKLNENGIITGIADSFCLSCHTYLKLKDVQGHITDSGHQKTFETTSYVETYQEDRIRKVKMGYFCEICNLLIQTLAKTRIHINEVVHVNNKNTQQLKDTDEGVVAFDDILIKQNAWHGLADGSCLICNVDYSDEEDHKKESSHILKLIQSKFELNKNTFVYRKVDEDTFNCMTCNTIITEESKDEHVNESEHKNNYLKCQNGKNLGNVIDPAVIPEKTKSENKIIAYVNDTDNIQADDNDVKVLTPLKAIKRATENKQADDNDIEVVTPPEALKRATENKQADDNDVEVLTPPEALKRATENKQADDNDVEVLTPPEALKRATENKQADDNDVEVLTPPVALKRAIENKHADDNDVEVLTPPEALKKAKEFAKENKLKYKRNGTYCKVCNIKISSSLRMMKEHVAESLHKEKVANETSITIKKVPLDTFVNFMCTVTNLLFSDVIINDEICVTKSSFHIILIRHLQRLKCQACQVKLNSNTVEQHIKTSRHIKALEATSVLIDFNSEFVREVRPAVYHCGYCNLIENSLEGLKNHLKSINHHETKSEVQRRIHIHLPQIKAGRTQKAVMDYIRFVSGLNGLANDYYH